MCLRVWARVKCTRSLSLSRRSNEPAELRIARRQRERVCHDANENLGNGVNEPSSTRDRMCMIVFCLSLGVCLFVRHLIQYVSIPRQWKHTNNAQKVYVMPEGIVPK